MASFVGPSFQDGRSDPCAWTADAAASAHATSRSLMVTVLLPHHHPPRLLLEVEVLRLLDRDSDEQDLPALEAARRLVLLAHRVGAVGADAEAAAEAELARLRPHRALGDELVVDVELRGAHRLAVLARLFPDELDSDRVLARLQLALRDEM